MGKVKFLTRYPAIAKRRGWVSFLRSMTVTFSMPAKRRHGLRRIDYLDMRETGEAGIGQGGLKQGG